MPTGNFLESVCYGNGRYLAAGDAILTSTNGTRWSKVDPGPAVGFNAVAYGSGLFVAAGHDVGGLAAVAVSSNAIDWQARSFQTPIYPDAAAYGNGRFVVIGTGPTNWCLLSTNGSDWAAEPVEAANVLWAVTYGNGIFVAVGYNYYWPTDASEMKIITSSNGVQWTAQTLPAGVTNYESSLQRVTYGNGLFVAVGSGDPYYFDGPLILTSADGTNWMQQYHPGGIDFLNNVVFGNGVFFAAGGHWGSDGHLVGDVLASTNGADWVARDPLPMVSIPSAVTWGAGMFVAVGPYGQILSSTDAVNWTNHTQGHYGPDWDLNGVASHGNTMVAVGGNPDVARGGILTCTNGVDWFASTSNVPLNFQDVLYAAGKFVAVGFAQPDYTYGTVFFGDGSSWSRQDADFPLFAVTYGNGRFVGVGGVNDLDSDITTYAYTSADGIGWCDQYIGLYGPLRSVAFGNGLFVAPQMTSSDGANWTPADFHAFAVQNPGERIFWTYPSTVVFGNGRFVAADAGGDIWTSTDGRSWATQGNLSRFGTGDVSVKKLVYANHNFVALSYPIFTSPDGITWTAHPLAFALADVLKALTYANGSYIGVGDFGAILQTDPVAPASTSFSFAVRTGAAPELILSADPGRAFRIECRNSLGPSDSWQVLTNLYPPSSPFSWQDTQAPSARQRFYRAFMLP